MLPVIGSVCSEHFYSGQGGLLQLLCMSLLPCHRYFPAGASSRTNQSSITRAAFASTLKARPPEISPFEVTLRSLALRPGSSLTIPRTALSMGFNRFGFPCGCHPSYGSLVPFPAGLAPAEHACLTWTYNVVVVSTDIFSILYWFQDTSLFLSSTCKIILRGFKNLYPVAICSR